MLRIVGDCCFADGFFDVGCGVGTSVKNGANPFQYMKEEGNTDYWIGNFECVCSNISNKNGVASRQFIIEPAACKYINHLDFYGVANNHVMQHGPDAYGRMIEYFEKIGVAYAGTKNKRTTIIDHQGKRVSITVFNQRPENFAKPPLYWAMPEYEDIKKELLDQVCDFRIVYVHWGVEFINYPYNDQKQFAHFLVDCGFDLVIGMHPHVMQGLEVYKEKFIFYSLGNCVFNMPWEPTKYSLMVNVDLETNGVTYRYLRIGKDCFPKYEKDIPEVYSIEYLNSRLGICEDDETYFAKAQKALREYRKSNKIGLVKNIWKMSFTDFSFMLFDYIKRKLS